MTSFSDQYVEDKFKHKSNAYQFLFENLRTSCRKSLGYQNDKEFYLLHDDNTYKRHYEAMIESYGDKLHKSRIKPITDQMFNWIYDNTSQQWHNKIRSECTQENELERWLDESEQKCISDLNPLKIGRVISEYNSDSEWGINDVLNQPCILLENEDSDGLLITDIKIEEFYNSYEEKVSFTKLNWEHFGNNQVFEESAELEKGEKIQRVDEVSSEILKINSISELWIAKEDLAKDKNKSKRFTFGRTWFRAMSNYYKNNFEPILKEWEEFEPIEERVSMDDLVTKFIQNQFELGDAFVSSPNFKHFLDWMVTILHSHNHRKNVEYIK